MTCIPDDGYCIDRAVVRKLVSMGVLSFQGEELVLSADVELGSLRKSLGFEDIAIYQKKNKCKSRLDASIKSEVFRGVFADVPLLAANMSTVCDAKFCIEMNKAGAIGVLHRAAPTELLVDEVEKMASSMETVCASVGVSSFDLDLFESLVHAGANVIFVDIAHGYSDHSIDFCRALKSRHSNVKIVIGNTINPAIMEEVDSVVDAVKVGIAQGLACETKNTAGCTEKQFSAVYRFKHLSKKLGLPIISDGGIREPADFTKAIGAGASSAMAGSIFARCPESAAEVVGTSSGKKKLYAGMASRYVQERWKGKLKAGTCPEGGIRLLDEGESVHKLIERYSGALRSGITYSGATNIKSFHEEVEFIRI